MSHVLLLPFGTSGSIFPFIWLGRQLIERGHRVTMVAASDYQVCARQAGLEFMAVAGHELNDMLGDARVWKIGQGTKLAFKHAGLAAGPTAEAVGRLMAAGAKPDLMLAPMVTFGARMSREKFGIPLVSVHLYPLALMSAYEVPLALPIIHVLRLLPLPLRKWILSVWGSPFDEHALPDVRSACQRISIPPPKRIWREWDHSPDGVLALFPEWFARPQPDWPSNVLQWDFPLEDMAGERSMSPTLLQFATSAEKPVLFTPGTGNKHARQFFETAVEVVGRLACRAIFSTMYPSQLPANLPSTIKFVEYAPFSELLPHCSALVHPGGIGTLSQSLMAGVPQVITPLGFDQYDNGERLQRMGVAVTLNGTLSVNKLVSALQRCLHDSEIQKNTNNYMNRMRERRASSDLVDWLEKRVSRGILPAN